MKLMLHIMQLNYRGKIFSNYTHIYTKGKVHETGYNGTDRKHTELDATAIGSRLLAVVIQQPPSLQTSSPSFVMAQALRV